MLKSAALSALGQNIFNSRIKLTWEPQSLWKDGGPCCSTRTDRFLFACPEFPQPSTAQNPHPTGGALLAHDSKPLKGVLPPPRKPSITSVDSRLPPWERYHQRLNRLTSSNKNLPHFIGCSKKNHQLCTLKEWFCISEVYHFIMVILKIKK